ncbi:MAG: hypothetical protein H0W86_04925 [Armatimonadetes bacterium]|nr:hypothetical protein [Armatimonadota bacterium]
MFPNWKFNGGLFAGMIDDPDRSGLGRSQLLFPQITNTQTIRNLALSLFMMPVNKKGGGQLYLGAYWPHTPYPPTYPAENDQTWANQWTIDPGELWDGTGTPNFSLSAISEIVFPPYDPLNLPVPDYKCWQLTRGLTYETDHDIKRVCVATKNEPAGPTGFSWRSFSSKEFNAQGLPFPHHDVHPRLWVVKVAL